MENTPATSSAARQRRTDGVYYRWIRDLHLYFGLFVSPFILLFAGSVFFLNHAKVATDRWTSVNTLQNLRILDGFDRMKGREAVERAREILPQLGVTGEIGFLRYVQRDRHLIFPVSKPGVETMVDVDLDARSASVSRRTTGFWEALSYLHKMPGPHNVAIRGNWLPTRVWRWFADATIYLTLFISMSGIYLWWMLKAERRIGLTLLGLGAATLVGLIHVLIH